jgi:hypothetical protein
MSKRSEGDFCAWVGIAPQTLRSILDSSRRPSATTVAKLAAKLEPLIGALPPVDTANTAARERVTTSWLKTEFECLAPLLAEQPLADLSDVEKTALLTQWKGTPEGRAYASLKIRLAHFRKLTGVNLPARAEMARWERECAERLQNLGFDVTIGQVDQWWQQFLVKRGLKSGCGRRPLSPQAEAERSEALHRLMRDWPWDGTGDAPDGFDDALGRPFDLTYMGANSWRRHHIAMGCNFCAGGK